jgi:hypothetical protein
MFTLNRFYLALGSLALGWRLLAGMGGWEFGGAPREQLPAGVRGESAYRTFHFWHSGYHGGK